MFRDGMLKKCTIGIYKSIYRHFLLLRIDYRPRERMGNSLASGWLSTVTSTVIYRYRDTLPTLPTLIPLDQLLSSQKAGCDALSVMPPLTKRCLTDWTAVRHALAALLSSLRTPMMETEQFVVPIS